MKRKIVALISFVVLAALAGGLFYFWQDQKDVRALNKTLPKDVLVTKSLWGNEYRVVNKIDNYEFKVPKAWAGVSEIEYVPEKTEKEYTGSSIGLEGKIGGSRVVTINRFKDKNPSLNLKSWAEDAFKAFGLIGDFTEDKIGNLNVVKTTEDKHLIGMYVFFFRVNQEVFRIINGSEESIKEIILNGKW